MGVGRGPAQAVSSYHSSYVCPEQLGQIAQNLIEVCQMRRFLLSKVPYLNTLQEHIPYFTCCNTQPDITHSLVRGPVCEYSSALNFADSFMFVVGVFEYIVDSELVMQRQTYIRGT